MLSPFSFPPHFSAQELLLIWTYVIDLKFGTLKPHPERNIQRMLFCSEMSAHLLTKYYIAGFCGVIVENAGTPLKYNKFLFSSFLKFMNIIEFLGHSSLDI